MNKSQLKQLIREEIKALDEIGMFHDPLGYEKSKPNPSVFTKKYVNKDAYDILKNGKKLLTFFGSEGEANAYINKRNRELIKTRQESINEKNDSLSGPMNEDERQLRDPKKEMLVVKDGKVIVIDKEDFDKYKRKGWLTAEGIK